MKRAPEPRVTFPETDALKGTVGSAASPHLSAADFVATLRRLWVFRSAQADFFERYDAICSARRGRLPVTRAAAHHSGTLREAGLDDLHAVPGRLQPVRQTDRDVPAGVTAANLPVGLLIAAPPGREDIGVGLAAALEANGSWAEGAETPPGVRIVLAGGKRRAGPRAGPSALAGAAAAPCGTLPRDATREDGQWRDAR